MSKIIAAVASVLLDICAPTWRPYEHAKLMQHLGMNRLHDLFDHASYSALENGPPLDPPARGTLPGA